MELIMLVVLGSTVYRSRAGSNYPRQHTMPIFASLSLSVVNYFVSMQFPGHFDYLFNLTDLRNHFATHKHLLSHRANLVEVGTQTEKVKGDQQILFLRAILNNLLMALQLLTQTQFNKIYIVCDSKFLNILEQSFTARGVTVMAVRASISNRHCSD